MKRTAIIIALSFFFNFLNSNAQVSTYKGQALFIWNFTKHIKWQSTPQSFTIGVLGKSELSNELVSNLKGKLVNEKPVEIKILSSMADASTCQIVYVPTSKSKELQSLVASIASKDVLIITEEDLAAKGAAISFLMVDEKLRFRINEATIAKQGLQVSGGLVSLAMRN